MPALAAFGRVLLQYLGSLFIALLPMLKNAFFQILLGLGVSIVSYEGLSIAVNEVLDYVTRNYFQMPADLIGLLGLAGIPEALNIIFGGFAFSLGIWSSYRAFKFLK
ncbi:DUF2523 domain-containing protein [Neisseria cinerea]|uniref:DUF2523 domain-containing protein n=1 Tax=Neisseria cinerea TaxID=483 RepID=UPI00288A2AEB|nr:DUF2523 domain-containing protein [Neisseria cinerea]